MKARSWRPSAGDFVLLSMRSYELLSVGSPKQREKFAGPYVIGRSVHPNAYELKGLPPKCPENSEYVEYLKPFNPNIAKFGERPQPQYAQPTEVERQVEWEVEAILAHRAHAIRSEVPDQVESLFLNSVVVGMEPAKLPGAADRVLRERREFRLALLSNCGRKNSKTISRPYPWKNEDEERNTTGYPMTRSLDPGAAPVETPVEQTG